MLQVKPAAFLSALICLILTFSTGPQVLASQSETAHSETAHLLTDSQILWLVNPTQQLEPKYRPKELTQVHGYPMHPEAGAAFLKMYEDMKSQGIKNLRLQSAYRPYTYQKALFNEKTKALMALGYEEEKAEILAARSVAIPSASEHQLGLAVDVSINGKLSVHFGSTEAGIWLQNHCDKYGFIIRYPKEKTEITQIFYEPWHLRYVGVPHSSYMQGYNMCLEEYIDHIKESGIVLYWIDDENYYKISYSPIMPDAYLNHVKGNVEAFSLSSTGPQEGAGYIITEFKKAVQY